MMCIIITMGLVCDDFPKGYIIMNYGFCPQVLNCGDDFGSEHCPSNGSRVVMESNKPEQRRDSTFFRIAIRQRFDRVVIRGCKGS